MNNQHDVDILLPTYNGIKYLNQQVESIMKQNYRNIKLLIRDDGSSDGTQNMIYTLKGKYENKIEIISDNYGNLKTANSIMELMKHVKAPYIMLADQDDIWFENKVNILLHSIKKLEEKNKNMPLLVTSDAKLIDEKGKIIANSFMKYSGINGNRTNFSNLLQKNIVQGSACIFNRKLLEIALIDNLNRVFHDAWLGTIAAAFGKVYCVNKPLMLYRQHSNNVVGAIKKESFLHWWTCTDRDRKIICYQYYLSVNRYLCKLLMEIYGYRLSQRNIDILNYFLVEPNSISKFIQLGLLKEFGWFHVVLRCFLGVMN